MQSIHEIFWDISPLQKQLNKTVDQMRQNITDWLPPVLIFTGMALTWMEIDQSFVVMNVGFLAYGILGVIDSIKRKYHTQLSIKLLKMLGQIIITYFAVSNLIGLTREYLLLKLMILLDRMILTPNRIEPEAPK